MIYSQLQTEVFVRGAVDTTSSFISEQMVRNWLEQAYIWAASYHKWPFTEYMDKSGAFTSGTEQYSYPNTSFKTDSIRLMKIGSYLFDKKNFSDYLRYREDYSSGVSKIFSDFGRVLYVNPNCASGTIYTYGQLTPISFLSWMTTYGSEASASTVFNNYDLEGDDAIIEKVLSWVSKRKGDLEKAADYSERAKLLLDELWQRCKDEQFAYQTKDRNMFSDFDVLEGGQDDFRRLQF